MLYILRKLGILRVGKKSYRYTDGRDMPAEALMEDVVDADKDLVNGRDVTRVRNALKTSRGRVVLIWGSLAVIAFLAACFVIGALWDSDSSPGAAGKTAAGAAAPAAPVSAGAEVTAPAAKPRPLTPADEVAAVFAGVRDANLREDIAGFMNYYADNFPDRPAKERKTLETWQAYDFASLDFFVFDLKVDGERAHAAIGWEMALLEKGASTPRLIETTNQVELVKGGSGWQIVSLQ